MATKTKTVTKPAAKGKEKEPEVVKRDLPAARRGTQVATVDYGHVGPGAGMEGADKDSFAIPFIVILQKLSPQLDRGDPSYIKGAKDGDFLNTANNEFYDGEEGILVMPVSFKRSFVIWGLREKGGGFKGEIPPSDPRVLSTTRDEKGRERLPDGNTQLVDTRMHAVILIKGDAVTPAIINMSSTQIKKSKRWMSGMQELQRADNYPTFAHFYKLTTVGESNDKGNWAGWVIAHEGMVQEQEHIDAAVAFYQSLQSGAMKMAANATMQAGEDRAES